MKKFSIFIGYKDKEVGHRDEYLGWQNSSFAIIIFGGAEEFKRAATELEKRTIGS